MDSNDVMKNIDDVKTIAEHRKIITDFVKSGKFDRDDALKKYKDFMDNHLEYKIMVETAGNNNPHYMPMAILSDSDIVGNLNMQVVYLTGKSILEELKNG